MALSDKIWTQNDPLSVRQPDLDAIPGFVMMMLRTTPAQMVLAAMESDKSLGVCQTLSHYPPTPK